jgi:hypothetical protein
MLDKELVVEFLILMDSALIRETYGIRIAGSSFVSAFFLFKGENLVIFLAYFVCHVLSMPSAM